MMAGDLRERLSMLVSEGKAVPLASLVRSSVTATATCSADHGLATGEWVEIVGASPTAWNGRYKVTVTGARTFTFLVGALATPAAGNITAQYFSDAQGGRKAQWRTVDVLPASAELHRAEPLSLSQGAVQGTAYRLFTVRARTDLVPGRHRFRWAPTIGGEPVTMVLHSVQPVNDGRQWATLLLAEVAS